MEHLHLHPGTLWPAILRQTEHALRLGALRPIETIQTLLEERGICFLVRQVSSLARKEETRQSRKVEVGACSAVNPFLPYDPDLFVADLSDTHVALLNKFNVIDHHLLIVTRCFKPQDALLEFADFVALAACMAEFDGLGFYNGGAESGASQRHKHLQIVPLPLGESGPPLPIESVIRPGGIEGLIGTVPGLPFLHAFGRLELAPAASPHAANAAIDCYHALLEATGLRAIKVNGELHQSAPYNLLVTRRWMLLVPRHSECVEGISVNALGFAGSLFVRDAAQMEVIKRLGPMSVLKRVAVPAAAGRPGPSVWRFRFKTDPQRREYAQALIVNRASDGGVVQALPGVILRGRQCVHFVIDKAPEPWGIERINTVNVGHNKCADSGWIATTFRPSLNGQGLPDAK